MSIYQNTAYSFENSEQAAARFSLKELGNIYTRLTSPTTDVFSAHLAAVEGGVFGVPTSSGSSAVFYAIVNCAAHGDNTVFSNKIYAIPYGYIESIGIDTTPIKNDEVEAYATTYIKDDEPNYLYVYARVENNDSTPYYTCYNLKYSISDQNKEEYEMLHEGRYIQAPLFVQELSNQKTPVEAKVASLTKARYESYLREFKRDPIIQEALGEDIDFTLLGFSVEDQTFDVQIMTHADSIIDKGEIRTVQLIPNIGSPMYTVGNNVLDYPLAWTCTSEELEKFQNKATYVTYYFTNNIVNLKDYELEFEQ